MKVKVKNRAESKKHAQLTPQLNAVLNNAIFYSGMLVNGRKLRSRLVFGC